ncbi:hypothetical protein V3C99_008347 [Haemonchus contortus]|uniref:Reverse transcriptase domain-containing protein n=1 Tax=Haemonchus contortus TaxID=6289 RepID=A0A7I5EB42_HAECO
MEDLDRLLINNVVRDRHFGERVFRSREATLSCIFCRAIGKHYADACPTVRTVDERLHKDIPYYREAIGVLGCLAQKEYPLTLPRTLIAANCYRSQKQKADYHASTGRLPKQFVHAQRKRWETIAAVDKCRRMLDECDAEIRAAHRVANRDKREEFGTLGASLV